ncbi:MAG: cobalamin B12-binding domain-containing protein, partial [Chloroflexi bacterium]|nr:cobalamin B12-binding domain-containing protein [Chloroflexota bacterium]
LHTLRAWERRYGVPRPDREQSSRYRVYSEDDIADVLWMKRQIAAGMSPSQASRILREQGRTGEPAPLSAAVQPLTEQQSALQSSLLGFDIEAAQRILDEALALVGPENVVLAIIEPTMRAIGEGWLHGEVSVAQEHFASHVLRQRLLAVMHLQTNRGARLPHLIAACAPEEQHELGLLSFALLARRQGWPVCYLGQRTPLDELWQTARALPARMAALSVTSIEGLHSLIPLFAEADAPSVPLLFGGAIFARAPSLPEHVPGTFVADAIEGARILSSHVARTAFWAPPKRLLRAAMALDAQRLAVASHTVAQLRNGSRRPRILSTTTLSRATMFLLDVLTSALAFDAPDLMESEGQWLNAAMTPRVVPTAVLQMHVDATRQAIERTLEAGEAKLAAQMLARLREALGNGEHA